MVDHAVEPGRHMRAEIAEQPERWGILLETQREALLAAARLVTDGRVASVVLVGRGSSDHAAIYGQYLVEMVLGRPAGLATPSVTSLLGRDLFDSSTLVATVESARRSGSPTLSLTNDASSDLARAADVHIDLCAGPELSVAATKSYTAELVALHAWVRLAAGEPFDAVRDDVAHAAEAAKAVVERSVVVARAAAAELVDADRVLVIGRGYSLATAKEAALKLIETCALAASGWSAADAKHGPLGQVVAGTPVFLLATAEFGRESVLVVSSDVVARGGRVFPVGARVADLEVEQGFSDLFPAVHEALVPMLEIIPMQQLALELALLRGQDPDRPTGLTKVTRTL